MFGKYNLLDYKNSIILVSDGGSENKGEVDKWINELDRDDMFVHKTARTPSFLFTNNEIESVFNIFKNEFLVGKDISDTATAKKMLEDFMLYYNNERFLTALYGLTAQEVFDGEIIDKYRFEKRIKQAQKDRIAANKANKSCKGCF